MPRLARSIRRSQAGSTTSAPVAGAGRLAVLADAPPGPDVMQALVAYDPIRLDADDRVSLLVAWERQAAWVHAQQQAALAAVAGTGGGDDWGREEVAAALRLSTATAQRRIDVARELSGRLAATRSALARGTATYWHTAALAEGVRDLSDRAASAVEARVLPKIGEQTLAEFRRSVRRAVLAVQPMTAEEAHERAAADRSVSRYPEPDGMALIVARLRACDAQTVLASLDALSCRVGPDDTRPVTARRADALVELCAGTLAGGTCVGDTGRRRRRRRAHLNVTVDLPTLLGLAENPAYLEGYGPVPASVARELSTDSAWRRFVNDPLTGELLDRSPGTYRPGGALVAFARARDRVCGFPGCSQPAWRCDVDHAVPFDAGGVTTRENTGVLCRRHHRLKHEGGWQMEREGGRVRWRSPAGRRYDVAPPPFPMRT